MALLIIFWCWASSATSFNSWATCTKSKASTAVKFTSLFFCSAALKKTRCSSRPVPSNAFKQLKSCLTSSFFKRSSLKASVLQTSGVENWNQNPPARPVRSIVGSKTIQFGFAHLLEEKHFKTIEKPLKNSSKP